MGGKGFGQGVSSFGKSTALLVRWHGMERVYGADDSFLPGWACMIVFRFRVRVFLLSTCVKRIDHVFFGFIDQVNYPHEKMMDDG